MLKKMVIMMMLVSMILGLSSFAEEKIADEAIIPVEGPPKVEEKANANAERKPLIQIAILLDTSNSMDGLIDQAKAHLWKVVNELATTEKDGQTPELQVALYEYGNNSISANAGYVRLVVPLSTDLDKISEELFALRTNGGEEYCGWAIKSAISNLKWSDSNEDLKAIFIAGNEPFIQGRISYIESCQNSIKKGVVVNTIFCGPEQTGIQGKWKEGADLADGSYMFINHNKKQISIVAPQDKEIARIGAELNRTYVQYGQQGQKKMERQQSMDAKAKSMSAEAGIQRQVAKASKMYNNAGWDLVDLTDGGKNMDKVKKDQLPEELKKMTDEELKKHIEGKAQERAQLKEKLNSLNKDRMVYIEEKKKDMAKSDEEETFDSALIKNLNKMAKEKNFKK